MARVTISKAVLTRIAGQLSNQNIHEPEKVVLIGIEDPMHKDIVGLITARTARLCKINSEVSFV